MGDPKSARTLLWNACASTALSHIILTPSIYGTPWALILQLHPAIRASKTTIFRIVGMWGEWKGDTGWGGKFVFSKTIPDKQIPIEKKDEPALTITERNTLIWK